MPTEHDSSTDEPERNEHFPVTGPLELDVNIALGRVEIHLDQPAGGSENTSEATVHLRHEPSAGTPWASGVHTLFNWLGDSIGEPWTSPRNETPADALAATRIERFGGQLLVAGPKSMPARTVPLAVTVHAPAGSQLRVRTTSADITSTGRAAGVEVATGSGSVSITESNSSSSVRTGSGGVDIGRATGTLSLRTGSGTARITELHGNADLVTGTATAEIGTLDGELFVRAGSGHVRLTEARSGSAELISGSGDIRIGIGHDALAEIDVSSGAGRTHSELEVSETPPQCPTAVTVHARSGTGDVTVTSGPSVS